VSDGEINKVAKYISKGIDVNFQDDFGDTPLTLVEKRKIAKMLLDNNADINKRGKYGYTPLMVAIKKIVSKNVKIYDKPKGRGMRKN
uniref:ankyrin repeat domain-containing protein n=1 Tax=Brachyspira hyodysenteriae TaxID=159 RepID=UPI001F52D98D